MRFQDQAIILRRTPFKESAWLIHCLSRQHGLISGVVKGGRQTGKKSGQRSALIHGFHTVMIAWGRRGERSLGWLDVLSGVRFRHHILTTTATLMAGQFLVELIYRFSPPEDPALERFILLETSLDQLNLGVPVDRVVLKSQEQFLWALGFGWQLDCCAGCERRDRLDYLSIKKGQAVCKFCASPYRRKLLTLEEPFITLLKNRADLIDDDKISLAQQQKRFYIGRARLEYLARRPLQSYHTLIPWLEIFK
ncbi:DNA repair protein RecO [Magnetococcales bacterium HHB-1]